MSAESCLLVEVADGVATLTLNRPEQRNALSPELVCRLADAWVTLDADPAVRIVVITGRGSAFCAGADLRSLVPLLARTRGPEDTWDERVLEERLLEGAIRQVMCAKPIIAAINGTATAGGLELALSTDIRVAADSAKFGLAEVQRGLIPGGGGIVRLCRQVPRALAMELLLTGDAVSAERALSMGLVNIVVPAADVLTTAKERAQRIAANGPVAVQTVKHLADALATRPLAEALRLEYEAFERVLETEDAQEGPLAFAERRSPRFTGR